MSDEIQNHVITFYSYKGGTGRTMALANVACLLARQAKGKGVLMIDWDLEAPGLHRFFQDKFTKLFSGTNDIDRAYDEKDGLIDLFYKLNEAITKPQNEDEASALLDSVNWDQFILETDIKSLYLLKAGRFDEKYAYRVNTFNWVDFYNRSPSIFRLLAEHLTKHYQYVLIDSRTGITDISGICTNLMPDKLVVVFTPNRQSLMGLKDLIQKAASYRKQSDDLRPLAVFPLPSRIEYAELDLRRDWRYGNKKKNIVGYQSLFENLFKYIYSLPDCDLRRYFDEVQIQHIPRYAYGEEIAVLVERLGDRLSLARSYESFTKSLVDHSGPWEYIGAVDIDFDTFLEKVKQREYDAFFIYNEYEEYNISGIIMQLASIGILPAWLQMSMEFKENLSNLSFVERNSRSLVIFIGKHGLSFWQRKALRYILNGFEKTGRPIITVLLPGAEQDTKHWGKIIDIRDISVYEAIDRLIWGITGKHPDKSKNETAQGIKK